jgi:hypothetical protein
MKQNTKNFVAIGAIAAAGFLLAKQIARNALNFAITTHKPHGTAASASGLPPLSCG